MAGIVDLPVPVLVDVLSKWVLFRDMVNFDTASCANAGCVNIFRRSVFQNNSFVFDLLLGSTVFPKSLSFRNKVLASKNYMIERQIKHTAIRPYYVDVSESDCGRLRQRPGWDHCVAVHWHQIDCYKPKTVMHRLLLSGNVSRVKILVVENSPLISTKWFLNKVPWCPKVSVVLSQLTELALLNCDLVAMTSEAVKHIGANCQRLETFSLTYAKHKSRLSKNVLSQLHKEEDIISMVNNTANSLKSLRLDFHGFGRTLQRVVESIGYHSLELRCITHVFEIIIEF